MRTINITFEDSEFERLTQAKGDEKQPWRQYILFLLDAQKGLDDIVENVIEGNVLIKGNLKIQGDIDDQ